MTEFRVTESKMLATPVGPEVTTFLVQPDEALAVMVLGHGSGTPIHKPHMVELCEALARQGVATFRYNYPYSEGMTDYSPELIDPLEVLLATTGSAMRAANALSLGLPMFLGGRSMSSQVVSLALSREHWREVRGVVLYVFPMRWRNLLDDTVAHLRHVSVPMLFVQGGRDEKFADLNELRPVLDGLGSGATLHVVDGADHFYDLPSESDRTREDTLTEVASVTATWIHGLLKSRPRPEEESDSE
ncbi:MAG: alpha/beta hydrolase [Chloroflexi bacterium]|nr:alpha/beta hydrolase [Chloroflexota bacterium]